MSKKDCKNTTNKSTGTTNTKDCGSNKKSTSTTNETKSDCK